MPDRDPDRHSVFVSYSWDSDEHKAWVLRLAEALQREPDIDVTLDQFDLWAGKDLTHFMERGLECDRVVIVSTPMYVRKSAERIGGVGYESSLITGDLVRDMKQDRFIPVLRGGDETPAILQTKVRVDFRDDDRFEGSLQRLVSAIRRQPEALRPDKRIVVDSPTSAPARAEQLMRRAVAQSAPQLVLEGLFARRIPERLRMIFNLLWPAS